MQHRNGLSILGFGCMRLPNNLKESEKLIVEAIESGVNYFDTAYMYSGNEAMLGQILSKNNLREKINIATKLPFFMCRSNADFDKMFNKQLIRLKTDYIDYYLMHMLSNPEQWRALCEIGVESWIADQKERGKIKNIGFSFHGKGEDFKELIDAYNWDFCMIQYNYLDVNNQAGTEGLKYAASKGIPVMVMEPLRGGNLAGGLPEEAVKVFKECNPSRNPAEWALKWLWNQSEVSLVLSGMTQPEQLRENIRVSDETLPDSLLDEEKKAIDDVVAVFRKLDRIPCTGCGYCVPCPVGVNIPGCFAGYNSYCSSKKLKRNQYFLNTGAFVSKKGTAGACIKCGKCEPLCPQSIPIRDSLKTVAGKMEPLWYKVAMPVVRRFTSRKKQK